MYVPIETLSTGLGSFLVYNTCRFVFINSFVMWFAHLAGVSHLGANVLPVSCLMTIPTCAVYIRRLFVLRSYVGANCCKQLK